MWEAVISDLKERNLVVTFVIPLEGKWVGNETKLTVITLQETSVLLKQCAAKKRAPNRDL